MNWWVLIEFCSIFHLGDHQQLSLNPLKSTSFTHDFHKYVLWKSLVSPVILWPSLYVFVLSCFHFLFIWFFILPSMFPVPWFSVFVLLPILSLIFLPVWVPFFVIVCSAFIVSTFVLFYFLPSVSTVFLFVTLLPFCLLLGVSIFFDSLSGRINTKMLFHLLHFSSFCCQQGRCNNTPKWDAGIGDFICYKCGWQVSIFTVGMAY